MTNTFGITARAVRWYADGSENAATALSSEGTTGTLSYTIFAGVNAVAVLRYGVQESGAGTAAGATTDDYQLQYSKNGGAFTNVTGASSNVRGFASSNLADAGSTTQQLSSGTGSFVAGEISEDGLLDDWQLTANDFSELLFAVEVVAADVAEGNTLDFRVLRNGSVFNTYSVTPRLTVTKIGSASGSASIVATGSGAGASTAASSGSSAIAITASGVGEAVTAGTKARLFNSINPDSLVFTSDPTSSPLSAVTVEAWINFDTNDEGNFGTGIVWKDRPSANAQPSYALHRDGGNAGKYQFSIHDGTTQTTTASLGTALSSNTWYFLSGRWTSGEVAELRVYDEAGTLVASTTSAGTVTGSIAVDNLKDVWVGRDFFGNYWGTICRLRVYSSKRSDAQIESDRIGTTADTSALLHAIMESSGSTETDVSGHFSAGSYSGTTLVDGPNPQAASSDAGDGTAAITVAASGVGASTSAAAGTSAVVVAGSAVGGSIVAAAGTASVSVSGSGVGARIVAAAGTSAVAVSGSGTGASTAGAAGVSSVVVAASGTASSTAAASGLAAIVVAGTGVGTGIVAAAGTAAIAVAATGAGARTAGAAGTASIVVTATGDGDVAGSGITSGTGAAAIAVASSGVGAASAAGAGSASIAVTSAGTGAATNAGVGSAAVVVASSAVGTGIKSAAGTSACTVTGAAAGAATSAAVGSASITVTAVGDGAEGTIIVAAAGSATIAIAGGATGSATASGAGASQIVVTASAVYAPILPPLPPTVTWSKDSGPTATWSKEAGPTVASWAKEAGPSVTTWTKGEIFELPMAA